MVNGEEIKLELFADDLTAFLVNDTSLLKFLELLNSFVTPGLFFCGKYFLD